MLTLSLGLVHEALVDCVAFINDAIRNVLNLLLLRTRQRLEMSDVDMRLLSSLLGTSLPDVGAEDPAARGKDQMSSSVMGLQLVTSVGIDRARGSLSDNVNIIGNLKVDPVQHALANLDNISDVEDLIEALDRHGANIVHLAARGGIESALIKNDQVTLILLELISIDFQDIAREIHLVTIIEIEILGLWDVDGVVEDLLWCLHHLLLACRDLIVKVSRRRDARDLGDGVDGDAPGGHCKDPVIDRQLVLLFL